jgi:hypothetical protein
MKHFLHLFIFLLPLTTLAQSPVPIDKKTGHILYNGTIDAKGVSQAELYLRVKTFYSSYKGGTDAIQVLRDDAGLISGKVFTDVIVNDGTSTEKQRLWYTLSIELGDGRLTYEIKDFSLQRYCIAAKQIPCDVQTKSVAVESFLKPVANKKDARKVHAQPYSPENALGKATATLVSALEANALKEQRIAGVKPE